MPQVTIVGKRIVLSAIRGLKRDEHEDLVAPIKDGVRLEAGDFQWCERFKEADDVRFAAARLKPWYAWHRRLRLPLDGVVELVKDRRHIATPKRLVDFLHSARVAHSALLGLGTILSHSSLFTPCRSIDNSSWFRCLTLRMSRAAARLSAVGSSLDSVDT